MHPTLHPALAYTFRARHAGAPSPAVMSMEAGQLAGANTGYALYDNVHRVPKDEVKVLGRIGEGAFGEVSLATCAIFGKVAVKWLKVGWPLSQPHAGLSCLPCCTPFCSM